MARGATKKPKGNSTNRKRGSENKPKLPKKIARKLTIIPPGLNLRKATNSIRVFKKPIVLKFEYSTKNQTIMTKEGPATCSVGDAIMTGTKGERWPIKREDFLRTYTLTGTNQCYKKPIEVRAIKLNFPFKVKVAWSKSMLTGKPGDILVQYGPGDFGIVSAEIFAETYMSVRQSKKKK